MPSQTETNINTALSDVTEAADVAALTGNPIAGAVAAGLSAAGAVAGSVEADVSAHQSALATAASAANSLAAASEPVIAALPVPDQIKANGILSAISDLLAEFSKIF